MDLSGFGGNFASTLAADGICYGVTLLKKLALGSEETTALERCFEEALTKTIEQLVPDAILDSAATAEGIGDVLAQLLSRESVWAELIRAATDGCADLRRLTSLAEEEGVDQETLPFDWNDFLVIFLKEIELAARREVASADSKLRNRIGFSDLFRIRCELTTLTEKISQSIDRINAGCAEIDPIERFSDFLTEYLGREDRPKPFGGRRLDVESLNDWLNDSTGAPKLSMLAPAGRGKSALLVLR